MKKTIGVIAVGVVIGVAGYYYANGKVEDNLNASIKKANDSTFATKVEGVVSTNIILGTLKIKDLKIKSGENVQEGNLEIKGIQFYNKENLFSDKISITLNGYKSYADQPYTSDNSFVMSKSGEGKINLQASSSFVGTPDQGTISQEYNANISGVGTLYDTLTQDLSRSLVNNTPPENAVAYIGKLSGAKLDTLTLKVANDRFLKKALIDSAKSLDPKAQDKELLDKMNTYVENQIKQNVPEVDGAQAKVMEFYKTDKASLVVNFTNKTNKSMLDAYTEMLTTGNPAAVISQNYDVKLDLKK